MASRLPLVFGQYVNSAGLPYAGGTLSFYASGTSTPLATYSDNALSTPNANPLTLNSAGQPSTAIFLQNLAYKVILADANNNQIWTADPVSGTDLSSVIQTLTGSGSPTGVVAGTAGSAGSPANLPTMYWDYTNQILYVCTTTGSASTAAWTAINASSATPAVPAPQGYLTPTSATPVIAGDVTSATSLFYTPYNGNLVPIYNGAAFTPATFAELTLTLAAQHALNTIYDVFVFSNSGVLTLVTGPAWSASTAGSGARGTGAGTTQLSRVSGFWVNTVSMTGRNGATTYTIGASLATYLGSIFIDGTAGQITLHRSWGQSRKWAIWNAYNRQTLSLIGGDSTASWTYGTSAVRESNGSTANVLTVLCGLPEETVSASFAQYIGLSNNTGSIGVGWNSLITYFGTTGQASTTGAVNATVRADYRAAPFIGIANVTALENAPSVSNVTFFATQASMNLMAVWRG